MDKNKRRDLSPRDGAIWFPDTSLLQLAGLVVLGIPHCHICDRHLDKTMRIGAVIIDFDRLNAHLVTSPFGDEDHPGHIVDSTEDDAKGKSAKAIF